MRQARALFRSVVVAACAAFAAPTMASPTIDVDFVPSSITPGGTTQLYFFITNPDGVSMSGGALTTITYPAGLVNSATPVWTNTCSGTSISASAGGNTVSWTNLSLGAAPASCSIGILVTSSTEGTYSVTVPAGGFSASTGSNFSAVTTAPVLTVASPTIVVTSTADSGAGTLRQAILNSYLIDGCMGNVITFNIPGAGPHTISPLTELPALGCNASINGYSQPGSTTNTDTGGTNNANIQIIINGSGCTGCNGLVVSGSTPTIKGLSIHSFAGTDKAGIRMAGGTASIYGNYLGTDPGGNTALGNGYGVLVDSGSATIGYTDAGLRNLITGNLQGGIWVNAAGVCALAPPWEPTSGLKGAKVAGAYAEIYNNLIGGTRGGLNTVSNAGPGIHYTNGGGCSVPEIHQNIIRFNSGDGIYVASGGDMSIASNSIYSNSGAGVVVASGNYIAITSNSIHSNGGPGIDLGDDGITANDYANPPTTVEHDMDSGANRLVNHPVILSVTHNGGNTHVEFEMKGPPFDWVEVEFFSNTSLPATPSGETPLGASLIIQLDALGEYVSPTPLVISGLHTNISSTATHDSCGECGFDLTSEFSPAVAVVLPPTVTTTFSPASTKVGVGSTFLVVVSNPNTGAEITGVSYSVTLPNGIAVAQALASGCGTQYSAGFNSTTATLTNATVAAGSSCTYSITAHPEAAGTYTYNAAALTISSDQGSASNAAATTLTVTLQPPVVTVFLPPSAVFGSPVPMTVAVARTTADPAYNAISASITLPSTPGAVTVANPSNYVRGCGATGGSATAGGNSVSASGGSWASNGSCALISVALSFPAPGTYTISIAPGGFTYTLLGSPTTWSNTAAITATITITSPATFSLGTPSLAFGNQEVGTLSAPQSATISNSGTANLVLSSITGPAAFPVTGCSPLPFTIPGGGSCTLSVRFAPTTTGAQGGSIQIASNASGSPHSLGVSGTGTVAGASIAPSPAAFGNVAVGANSTQSLTVTNTGNANLNVTAVTPSGAGFTSTSNNCVGTSVAPGQTCQVSVTFAPTASGAHTGSVSVSSNGSGSPHTVALSGTGTAPGVSLAPSPAAFGSVVVSTNSTLSVTVTNTGTANLNVTAVARSGAGFTSTSNNCVGVAVAPGQACQISVTFAPTAAGPHTGTVSVSSNAAGSPHTVALSGTGTAPGVSLAPSPVSFGNVPVGGSAASAVSLTNTGTAPLSVISIATTGTSFSRTHTCPSSLAPGASCAITVTFAPAAVGPHAGELSVTTNAGASPVVAPLSGVGAVPAVSLSGTALAFGSQTVNTNSLTQTVTVTNTGTAPLGITAISVTGDFGFTGCASPLTLSPGASCTLSIYFFPTTTGSLTGTVSIVSNASGSPHAIGLSGTGTPLPVPGIALAPSSASFGTILVGQIASRVLALSNPGTANLDISSISVTEPLPPAAATAKAPSFSHSHDCPAALPPSAACSITVVYAPTAAGSHVGELRIVSNAAPSPLVAALSGSANPSTTPGLQLSASSVTFGPQFPNTTSAAQSVTLTSSGTAPLVITQVAASGDFSFSGCGPSTLAPGATCSFAITFRPFGEGPHSGEIVITSNAPGSPHTVSLSGTGSPRLAPEISLSPSSFAFGSVRTQRTVTLTSRLTNAGAAALEISRISSSGSFFAQSNNCPSALAVGAFCDITVTYAPTATGPHSGQLVIVSNALPSPYIAALSGTGIAVLPPFLSVAGALDFGQQVTGLTVRRTLTLANTGGDPLAISQVTLFGTAAFGLEGACATIAPERSCDLTVTFTPTGLAAFTARLDIVSNHSGGVVQVSLSGVGTALPRPALELSVGALGFGTQGVGSPTASQSVRLTSVGSVAAQINSIAASLPDFVVDANQCPALLAPQQSCEIGVAFKPVASGARIGALVVQSNAVPESGLPHSASLIGVGCRFFTVGSSRNPQRLCAP